MLRDIHSALRRRFPRPYFDGGYVGWDDLRGDPDRVGTRGVHEWRVSDATRADIGLVTWHTLARSGVVLRGPRIGDIGIHTDLPALMAGSRADLESYRRPWLAACSQPRSPWMWGSFGGYATSWGVLGVTRLRHTLAAGAVTSKTEAGGYALRTYDPKWHRIVREALRLRAGGVPQSRCAPG